MGRNSKFKLRVVYAVTSERLTIGLQAVEMVAIVDIVCGERDSPMAQRNQVLNAFGTSGPRIVIGKC